MWTVSVSCRVLAAAIALLAVARPAGAQTAPHWNVQLPAHPGTGSQKVTIASGVLTVWRTFPQNTMQISVPLKDVTSISQPYLYQNDWLIDLKLSTKVTMVNKLNVGMVDRTQISEASLMFLDQADAVQARTYLLARLHA
jgi:hypothetical protein